MQFAPLGPPPPLEGVRKRLGLLEVHHSSAKIARFAIVLALGHGQDGVGHQELGPGPAAILTLGELSVHVIGDAFFLNLLFFDKVVVVVVLSDGDIFRRRESDTIIMIKKRLMNS